MVRALRPEPEAWKAVLEETRLLRRDNPSEAAMLAQQALVAARAGGVRQHVALAARALGMAHHHQGKFQTALRHLREAFAHAAPEDRPLLAADLASTLATLGRSDEARAHVQDARRGLKGPKAARLRALLDISEATVLERLDQHEEALALLDRARAWLQRLKLHLALAAVDHNRANVLANLAQHEHAERIFRRITIFHSQRGETSAALQAEYNFTYVLYLRGRFHEALQRLRDLRKAFEEGGDTRHVALCSLDEAELLLRLNLFPEAQACALEAGRRFDTMGMRQDAARARFFAAVAARRIADPAGGYTALEQSHRELKDLGMQGWSARALYRLAEADRDAGRGNQARERAEEASRELHRLRSGDQAARADALSARTLEDEGRHAEALDRLLAVRAALGDDPHPWVACDVHASIARCARALGRTRLGLRHALRAVRIVERHRLTVPPDEYMAAFLRDKSDVYAEAVRGLLALGG